MRYEDTRMALYAVTFVMELLKNPGAGSVTVGKYFHSSALSWLVKVVDLSSMASHEWGNAL